MTEREERRERRMISIEGRKKREKKKNIEIDVALHPRLSTTSLNVGRRIFSVTSRKKKKKIIPYL